MPGKSQTTLTHKDEGVSKALDMLEVSDSKRGVLDALSLMIERAGLEIGDRLPPEIEIAKKLGVGRAKVREALTAWQNMGIVTRNKKAGTRLAAEVTSNSIHVPVTLKLEAESLLRTHSVRSPLEIECVRMAARNVTEQQARLIQARSAELMSIYEAGEDWRPADYRFHQSLQDASGNPLFGQLIQQIQRAFGEMYETPFGQPQLGQNTIPLHPHLAQAVVIGDEEEAVRIMEQIMRMVEVEIHKVMETYDV